MPKELLPAYVVVPAEIIDQHLASASGAYVKVLLAVLRKNSLDPKALTALVGQPESDVREALSYWVNAGALPAPKNTEIPALPAQAAKQAQPTKQALPVRLTPAQVADRVEKNEQLRFILNTSEGIYGRPLTDTERRGLVYFYEELELPADVIVMAVDFCITNGKLHFNYLQKLCAGWAEQEINTHALAEEYIKNQTQRWTNEALVQKAFGIENRGLTADNRRCISTWFYTYGFNIEMITLAYERTVDKIGKVSFPYINKILQSWHENHITTPEEVLERDQPPKAAFKNPGNGRGASYDVADFEHQGFTLPPDSLP
ncbi:MAG: DnaD domain protein [Oscillospiraceae bacterium]|nr:DnaD domain protein [Oscillospiraceae bacterium]